MKLRLKGNLSGSVTLPPSKSQAHRFLICAALGSSPCEVECDALNDDITATMNSLNALGAEIEYNGKTFSIVPVKVKKNSILDCGESGSTLRFLISVAAALGADATFIGGGNLPYRPNGALCDALGLHGMEFERLKCGAELPLACRGKLQGGNFMLPGNISSQYLTGLLMALPVIEQDSVIEIEGQLTSASYVDMTLDAIRSAGVCIQKKGNSYYIKGGQKYVLPPNMAVEGDWSSAAFWVVAGVIGKNPIRICGMNGCSLQGDRRVIDHLRKMGAFIDVTENSIVAMPSQLFGAELDCTDTPDLVPILSVAAAVAKGETLFANVGRLRYKECDRLAAMNSVLAAFGINSSVGEDTFTVYGGNVVAANDVDTFGDHRIAMSAAVLATLSEGASTICGAECVAKSYPRFFDDFSALGGCVENI